jgi:small-conductance mechanosensitive channel
MEMLRWWGDRVYFDNTVRQYLVALITLVGSLLTMILAKRLWVIHLGRWAKRTPGDFDDLVVEQVGKIGSIVFLASSLFISVAPLELDPKLKTLIYRFLVIALTVRAVLMLQEIARYAVNKACGRTSTDDAARETVSTNISNVLRWAIWTLGSVFVLDNLGINISALLAGLGISGIAVAIASQAILGDLFSAFSIFMDRPFEVGDYIVIENFMGTVEYIGMKTTRLRSLDGEQLVFANSDLTRSRIRNYKRMKVRRVLLRVGAAYETPAEKLAKVPEMAKEIFKGLKDVRLDSAQLAGFGDWIIFEIVYFIHTPDARIYMERQHSINLAVKEAFDREGIILRKGA